MLVRAGPQLSKETLGQKMKQIETRFPHAKIIELNDGFKITGISSEEEENIANIIEGKEDSMANIPAGNQPTDKPVIVQETPVQAQPADPPNTDIVQAMSKFVDQIAIAKSNEATKSVIEKYDKLETAEKLLVQRISSAETEIDALKDKIAILETAWQDERARNELRAASNAEEHKKSAENVAAITQHLKNIPLPK